MNQEQRRQASLSHQRIVERMEKPHVLPIAMAIHAQIIPVINALKDHGIEKAKQVNEGHLINHHLVTPLKNIYKIFGLWQARRTRAEINKSVRIQHKAFGFGSDQDLLDAIIAYLEQYILNKAVLPISQTTRDIILEKIIEGEQNGWGIEKIVSEIDAPELSISRARMIVRTEALKAMQFGQKTSAASSMWETESEWIATHDSRTRESHLIVDGVKRPEGKKFRVPIFIKGFLAGYNYMIGPGDPNASAGNVINCRCHLVTVAARDEKGQLIPKGMRNSRISVLLPGEAVATNPLIII